jgi:hypothetical protein
MLVCRPMPALIMRASTSRIISGVIERAGMAASCG